MRVATRARVVASGFDMRAPWAPASTPRTLPSMDDELGPALSPLDDWHVLDDRRLFHALADAGVAEPELSAFLDDRPAFDDLIDRALGVR